MGRIIFRVSMPDTMVEKFEGLINNINVLSNGAHVIIEKESEAKGIVATTKEEIVATPKWSVE